jgi:hypothetical protein
MTKMLRNAGLRLSYETHSGSIAGLKDGILLEVGFDHTASNRSVTISSWIIQFAEAKKLQYADNRALDIPCYNLEYTFVEKVQAVVRKYGQFKGRGKFPRISSDTTTTFINFSMWKRCRNSFGV